MTPAERFRAWLGLRDLSQTDAAKLLGCSQATVSRLAHAEGPIKGDGNVTAAIQRETSNSPLGQIDAVDWYAATDVPSAETSTDEHAA